MSLSIKGGVPSLFRIGGGSGGKRISSPSADGLAKRRESSPTNSARGDWMRLTKEKGGLEEFRQIVGSSTRATEEGFFNLNCGDQGYEERASEGERKRSRWRGDFRRPSSIRVGRRE